jgi:hypothetical protein
MITQASADDLVHVIRQLVTVCKRYDPWFDHSASSYSGSRFRLSLNGIPEADLERVAEALSHLVTKPIDFESGGGRPTIQGSCFIPIGGLTIFLCSKRRPATRAEIDAAMADIHRRAAQVGPEPEASIESPNSSPNGDQR